MVWHLGDLPPERRWPIAGTMFFVIYVVMMMTVFGDSLLSAVIAGLFVATFWTASMAWWERSRHNSSQG